MTALPILTDETLEALLARRSGHDVPADLARAINVEIAQMPQAHRPLWMVLAPSARPANPARRLVWAVTLVGLLLAVALSVVLVGSELLRRTDELTVVPPPSVMPPPSVVPSTAPTYGVDPLVRHPAPLKPTGVLVATGTRLFEPSALAVSADRAAWTLGSGRLRRIDADGGGRDWTLRDDPVFGRAQGLASSRFGGVWIFDSGALRRFDGSTFTDVVANPRPASGQPAINDAVEAPDGRLWVTTETGVFRWDGSTWTALPWTSHAIPGKIALDTMGRAWVGLYQLPGPIGLGVAVYDGTAWTEYTPAQGPLHGTVDSSGDPVLPNVTGGITASRDGSVWFATNGGLVRFDGATWTEEHPFGAGSATVSPVTVASDGSVWAAASSCAGCTLRIARFDGSIWQAIDPPSPGLDVSGRGALIAVTGDDLALVADSGAFRLAGGQWSRVWPASPPTVPGLVSSLVAVSADEVLAGSGNWDGGPAAVWRYHDGAWERDTSAGAPVPSVRSLAFGPGGQLWAGGDGGAQVRRDGTWTSVIDGAGDRIDGATVWKILPLGDGTVWVAAGDDGLIALHPDGETWRRETIGGLPLPNVHSVAVTSDGMIWAGSFGHLSLAGGGLARFDGRTWHLEYPLGEPPPTGGSLRIEDVVSGADGSLWVAGEEWASSDSITRTFAARFAAGHWTVYDEAPGVTYSLAEHPDGSILAIGDGVWTFADGRWTQELAGQWTRLVSIAPDGAVWVAGQDDVYRIR